MSQSLRWRAWAGAALGLLALGWACWPAERATWNWERGTDFGTVSYPARSAFRAPTSDFGRPAVAPPSADQRLDRPPSLSAVQVDTILTEYHSPAAGLGPVFYDLGVQYGIDPAFAVAFFVVERPTNRIRVILGHANYERWYVVTARSFVPAFARVLHGDG